METIFNFDMNAIKELNFKGMKEYKEKCEIRKDGEKINKLVLDADDILILKFIVGVGNSKNAVVDVTDSSFFWVNLNKLLEEYDGLLFLSKTALQVRLSKYQMMGIVDRKCVKNEKGSFSFFKLTGIKMLMKKECKEQVVETEEQAIKSIIDATGATR